MILQTKIPLDKETKNPISSLSKIFLLGSCFSENIGDQLKSKNAFGSDKLEVDITEMENATTFGIYTNHQTFRSHQLF